MSAAPRRWVHRLCRWALGLVLLLAAVGLPGKEWGGGKLGHPSSFAKNIRTYQMVPQPLVLPMAMYLPWFEFTTGLILLMGVWRRETITVTLALCGMFLLANVTALARGLEIDCGCFGAGYHGSAARETVIAAAMFAAGLAALATMPSTREIPAEE